MKFTDITIQFASCFDSKLLNLMTFLLLLVMFDSCCYQSVGETSTPITNNPEIIGYKEEWRPDPNDSWWLVSIYETLKGWEEENNK